MEFDDHLFGILACRALEYAQIISRFVRLDACELYPGVAFYVVDSVPFPRFANAVHFHRCWPRRKRDQSGPRNACDGHMRYI